MQLTAEHRIILMSLRIGTKAFWALLVLATSSWTPAFAFEIHFKPRDGVALVRDATAEIAETLECRAPFTPVEVDLRPGTGGVEVSNHFFEFAVGRETARIIRPSRGLRSYNSKLLAIAQSPAQTQPDDEENAPSPILDEYIANRQKVDGSHVAASISLHGCGYRSHLDLNDGTLAISGEIGRYQIEFATSFLEILTDRRSILKMDYAPTIWESETYQARVKRVRSSWPGRPEGIDSNALLGALFLDVLVDLPVTPNFGAEEAITTTATTIIQLNLNVIDVREDTPEANVPTDPVSRFAPIASLIDRN